MEEEDGEEEEREEEEKEDEEKGGVDSSIPSSHCGPV